MDTMMRNGTWAAPEVRSRGQKMAFCFISLFTRSP